MRKVCSSKLRSRDVGKTCPRCLQASQESNSRIIAGEYCVTASCTVVLSTAIAMGATPVCVNKLSYCDSMVRTLGSTKRGGVRREARRVKIALRRSESILAGARFPRGSVPDT
jgi:hypothetical protein